MISVHPFPARMAPELALSSLFNTKRGSVVLAPMTGSGTVARLAQELGLRVYGFDLDPLAVLISKVGTTRLCDEQVAKADKRLIDVAGSCNSSGVQLPWLDDDPEAERFVEYWFGERQRDDLRRIAALLAEPGRI